MSALQKNVASQFAFFGLVSSTTGAGLAGATVSVFITKDNGAQASGGGTVTSLGNGQYSYAFTQAETNATAVGVFYTATGAVPVSQMFFTIGFNPTAAQFPANVTQILGTASAGTAGYVGIDWGHVNAPTSTVSLSGTTIGLIGTNGITSASFAAGAITTSAFAAGAITAAVTDSTFDNAIASATVTNSLTEAYATPGSTLTLSTFAYGMNQFFSEFGITSTLLSVKKRNQVTVAKTYTLNSATTPTAITETT